MHKVGFSIFEQKISRKLCQKRKFIGSKVEVDYSRRQIPSKNHTHCGVTKEGATRYLRFLGKREALEKRMRKDSAKIDKINLKLMRCSLQRCVTHSGFQKRTSLN